MYICGPVCGVRPGLHAHSEYSVHSVDGGEVLFNEDVFSGTGVANVFLVILLECPPVGHQRRVLIHLIRKQVITKHKRRQHTSVL